MSKFILDTSALLAYIENEDGSNEVEALFNKALDNEVSFSLQPLVLLKFSIFPGRNKVKKSQLIA